MTEPHRSTAPRMGPRGAVAAGHPLAAEAGSVVLAAGGNAVDAAIAAQAVICVVMPQAAGLGGDMLALVRTPGGVAAVGGTGCSPAEPLAAYASDGGSSVTVPGIVDAWSVAHRRFGRLPLAESLAPAIRIAEDGFAVDPSLHRAAQQQRKRISRYGAEEWDLLTLPVGAEWRQPELAALLRAIAERGAPAFYAGAAAEAVSRAARAHGGALSTRDLARHRTAESPPVVVDWGAASLAVQPAPTQGVLLAMAARWVDRHADGVDPHALQHVLVEATEAAFAHRDESATRGAALLDEPLDVDVERARNLGGPRAYLHTAGVAVADAEGTVVSSLVSVFDDFGSGVFVPELGIVLNNRAGGFTSGPNAPGPGKRPVHTLAPAILSGPRGEALALATPGADGQVQTLLQVLARLRFDAAALGDAIAAPRWRSQDGELLVESDHPDLEELAERGHRIRLLPAGDDLFGAVTAAGIDHGSPFAAPDWRRLVTAGAA